MKNTNEVEGASIGAEYLVETKEGETSDPVAAVLPTLVDLSALREQDVESLLLDLQDLAERCDGRLTLGQVNELIPSELGDEATVEMVLARLDCSGVLVTDGDESDQAGSEAEKGSEASEGEEDSVRTYLRQMGRTKLLEPEEEVIGYRYGIIDGVVWTLEEVGRLFNVTRERVRQIEAKALRKLRHPARSFMLREYSLKSA